MRCSGSGTPGFAQRKAFAQRKIALPNRKLTVKVSVRCRTIRGKIASTMDDERDAYLARLCDLSDRAIERSAEIRSKFAAERERLLTLLEASERFCYEAQAIRSKFKENRRADCAPACRAEDASLVGSADGGSG